MRRLLGHTAQLVGLIAAILVGAVAPAQATNLYVPSGCAGQTKNTFATIQAAINAAVPNDSISVCAGTYNESVVIPDYTKHGLKLTGIVGTNGVKPSIHTTSNAPALNVKGGAWGIQVKGFQFNCSNAGGDAVRIEQYATITLEGSEMTSDDRYHQSVCSHSVSVTGRSDALVQKNTITYPYVGISGTGIGTRLRAYDNTITGGPSMYYDECSQTSDIGIEGVDAYLDLLRNTISDIGCDHDVYDNRLDASGIRVSNLLAGSRVGSPTDPNGGNTLLRNDAGINAMTGAGFYVANNVIRDNRTSGLWAGSTTSRILYYGNRLSGNLTMQGAVFPETPDRPPLTFYDCTDLSPKKTLSNGTISTQNLWPAPGGVNPRTTSTAGAYASNVPGLCNAP